MTDAEIKRAEQDAEGDAEWLALLLLLAFRRKDRKAVQAVRFDAASGKFYLNGRAVPIRFIRLYLTRIEERFARRLLKLTGELEAGTITVAEWKRAFDRAITSGHILAGALALGGISVSVRNAVVQERIAAELVFADEFAQALRRGKAGSFAKVRARAKSYMMATHVTYSIVEQTAREVLGVQTEAMRIRRAAESCKGCIKYSYRWIPINVMPPIGSLDCRGYCRCYLLYR